MRFKFKDSKLERLYIIGEGANALPENVVRRFLMTVALIAQIPDERSLYAYKGLRFEKLKGDRAGEYSLRLNQQYRLCFEVQKDQEGNLVYILEIVDYH
jgi:toxin HigB-1